MYSVVGCPECRAIWIREGAAETTTCPRCRTRHQVDRLRPLATTETPEAAREARTAILTEREGATEAAGYLETASELDTPSVPDSELLEAHEVEAEAVDAAGDRATASADTMSARERVRRLLEELSEPTEQHLLEAGIQHGLDPDDTREILHRLRRAGDVIQDGEGYRLL